MFLIFRLFSLYKQPYSESILMKAKIMDFFNYFLSNKKWQKYENNGKIVKKKISNLSICGKQESFLILMSYFMSLQF